MMLAALVTTTHGEKSPYIWFLGHFASVLATEAVNANFLHTMMIYIEKGIHDQILKKNVAEILI